MMIREANTQPNLQDLQKNLCIPQLQKTLGWLSMGSKVRGPMKAGRQFTAAGHL